MSLSKFNYIPMSSYMINATARHAIFKPIGDWSKNKHDGFFITRSQKSEPEISVGDTFISFTDSPKYSSVYEKYQMSSKGVIERITTQESALSDSEIANNNKRKQLGKPPLKFFSHVLNFKEAKPFNRNKYLDDYTYSLIKIYKRYLQPVRHFSRQITKLEKSDFETLEKEKIFYERTVFGKLINALPYQNRLEFILYSLKEFDKPDIKNIPISDAVPFLKKFVESGIIEIGKLLISSKEMINSLQDTFTNGIDIGFIDENIPGNKNFKVDLLIPQAELFENLFEISDFKSVYSSQVLTSLKPDLSRFNKLFGKRSWPVDINNE